MADLSTNDFYANDFNTIVDELIKRLKWTWQTPDGTIIWYSGAREYLFKFLQFIHDKGEL